MSDVSQLPGSLTIASPCPEDWNRMEGDEKRRYCGRCQLHVYNLSAMTSEEAAELVDERSGRLCVRFVRSHDGKVMTTDCPHPSVARRRKIFGIVSLMALALYMGVGLGQSSEPTFESRLRQFRPLRPIIDRIFGSPTIMGGI